MIVKIMEVYHHLSYIEESFRITESNSETRPIFVTKDKHIDGHLLTCFVSLIIIRLLQYKMGEQKISADRLKTVLTLCTCEKLNDLIIHLDSVSGNMIFKKFDFMYVILLRHTTVKLEKKFLLQVE